jgi:hypothetical protein
MNKHRKRHHLSTEERIRGLRAALASPRTPAHLRASLQRQLEKLDAKWAGQRPAPAKSTKHGSKSKPARNGLFGFLPF